MRTQRMILAIITCLCCFALSKDAAAHQQNPGSCLLFPYYKISNNCVNIISVTNMDFDKSFWVRFVWIDDEECNPSDNFIYLTPKDTFTCTAKSMISSYERGFLYVYAVENEGSTVEIDADCLIGQEIVVTNWEGELVYFSLNAVSYQCLDCNPDKLLHLDGKEYTLAPKTLHFPRFFGQSELFFSKLVLINLTGGQYFDVSTKWFITNDNEEYFSYTVDFNCFTIKKLTDISAVFSNTFLLSTMHDPGEPRGISSGVETGQFEITGNYAYNYDVPVIIDHASIYGFLIEGVINVGYSVADLPFQIECIKDHTNAVLWSTSPNGT